MTIYLLDVSSMQSVEDAPRGLATCA